jgi:hypothetical protein
VSSRMRIRLMRNTRDSGIGKGILYAHLSLFWEQRGIGWRSQGVSVRLEEMREVALALNAYADACGVPGLDPGAGVISPARATGRGRDTPSDDVNGTERPFPRHPQNQYGAWALAETRAQGWEPPPRPPKPADYESPDRPRKRAPKGPASVEASEPAPELDCNATAEDSDDEES